MSTVVVGEPDWLVEVIARRRATGHDVFDEVWDGVYHVAPNAGLEHSAVAAQILLALGPAAQASGLLSLGPFNLGSREDFRVPDGGWVRPGTHGTYAPTAVAILEVLSPEDETYDKFGFYLARGVEEILVAHPTQRWVRCYVNGGHAFQEEPASAVFSISMARLVDRITWPS